MGRDAQKHHPTDEQRATAVARVLAGESRRAVARDMGISDSTVGGWVKAAESGESERALNLAERAQKIAGEIEHWETIARERLIRRIVELAPASEDLAAVTNAFAKLSDKALLRAGKPTSITQTREASDVDDAIERLLRQHDEAEMDASRNGTG